VGLNNRQYEFYSSPVVSLTAAFGNSVVQVNPPCSAFSGRGSARGGQSHLFEEPYYN